MERCGAVVKRRTHREVPGSIPTNCKCCFLEQETLSTLLSTGFYPGKKRATWKISTRLLNVLPSINKVDYYYYYFYFLWDYWAHCGLFENGVLLMYTLEGVSSVANFITAYEDLNKTETLVF